MQAHFPTLATVLPRLPFALVPFALSQFILIQALDHQGWITIFAGWFSTASKHQIHPTIWLIGVLGIILCNLSGTNIGATILLTKVMQAAGLPRDTAHAGAIALAVASNIGAVSFTFSASLAGLLWQNILQEKRAPISQWRFAKWNLLPVVTMMCFGLTVISIEMVVLSKIGR
jgi:Na+/H+ antiporter NhaD/arsenite permease-like protein